MWVWCLVVVVLFLYGFLNLEFFLYCTWRSFATGGMTLGSISGGLFSTSLTGTSSCLVSVLLCLSIIGQSAGGHLLAAG